MAVYMLFAPDIAEYESRVRAAVGDATAARLRFFVHGQHNHEGPDTSGLGGPVNRDFFNYMFTQMVQVRPPSSQPCQCQPPGPRSALTSTAT